MTTAYNPIDHADSCRWHLDGGDLCDCGAISERAIATGRAVASFISGVKRIEAANQPTEQQIATAGQD